jgi:T-complex protein 1 subunit alpha
MLGEAETVSVERIADEELVVIKGTKVNNAASIILRGANTYMLEEMERSVHDVLCALKRVPGGGAVETAVAMHLEVLSPNVISSARRA